MPDNNFFPEPDKLQEVDLSKPNKHKDILENISTWNVVFDFFVKIFIFFGFVVYVVWQITSIHNFINKEMLLIPSLRLDSSIITTYVKYSLGYNSALILILGYWFGGNGGFSKLVHKVAYGIFDKRSQNK
jgi:magnesium-transporting ATPase (P-type)